mmetsp:Transcript_11778/g.13566  ORF Transcript_11778/g.13566 Transcript_11778/m.13566 type:complete len:322 (+) Transcript_11778:525-1490(+)
MMTQDANEGCLTIAKAKSKGRKRKAKSAKIESTKRNKRKGKLNKREATLAALKKRYQHEKPLCCMCLELAIPPVFSPCDCANLSCLPCFKTYIEHHGSVCVTCRRRLVGSMRRGGGAETLVDKELEKDIKIRYPNGEETLFDREEEDQQRKRRLIAPQKGELLAQVSQMNEKYELERRKEILATEEFLKQDKETKALMERLQRQKEDEEFAKRLQEQENLKKSPGGATGHETIRINEDEALAIKLQREENKKKHRNTRQHLLEDEKIARELQNNEKRHGPRKVHTSGHVTVIQNNAKKRRSNAAAKSFFKMWAKKQGSKDA